MADGEGFYTAHGEFTHPGQYGDLLEDLPGSVEELCKIIQGLLIHDRYGSRIYDDPPSDFHCASRETLPVSKRLDGILCAEASPINVARQPFGRSVGTCRDFALLLCAVLRQKSVPARVRCGFARYFDPAGFEDHWICEHWSRDEGCWRIADAQLDAPHRDHLSIDFDITDIPSELFVFPWQAWRMCRAGAAAPRSFGQGSQAGLWFVRVNLARDLLALRKCEVSAWDSWREARDQDRLLDDAAILQCERLAALTEAVQDLGPPALAFVEDLEILPLPPWQGA